MAYIPIGNNEVDPDSPITTSLMVRLRDNPLEIINNGTNAPEIDGAAIEAQTVGTTQIAPLAITEARQGDNSISQPKLQNSVVGQAECKTGQGSVTLANSAGTATLILPGGQYGFYPRIQKTTGVLPGQVYMFNANLSALESYIYIDHGGVAPGTTIINQRYFVASPPHDLGDGEIPYFCFVLLNNAGDIVAAYNAPEPPWMYNGPTKTTPDFRDQDGKQWIRKKTRAGSLESGEITEQLIEVTADIKKADIDLIPHPFIGMDLTGLTPVLLDPIGTERLLDLHESGEDIAEILTGGHLLIDNTEEITRAKPNGVLVSRVRWKP